MGYPLSRIQVKYYRDTYAEHPEDRKNIEYSVHLDNDEDLVTLSGMYFKLQDLGFNLSYIRSVILRMILWGDFSV